MPPVNTESNKRPANNDELAAAARLLAIWNAKKKQLNLTQTSLGQSFTPKITQGAVSQYFHGRTPLNLNACIEFAELLQVDVDDFAPSSVLKELERMPNADMDDEFFVVPYYKRMFAAGTGASDSSGDTEKLRFRWSWAEREGLSRDQVSMLLAVRAKGSSMEPQINDGETLIVRGDLTEVVNGRIYAIDFEDQQRVKRLYRHGDILLLVSDNPDREHGPDVLTKNDINRCRVIGQVWNRSGRVT